MRRILLVTLFSLVLSSCVSKKIVKREESKEVYPLVDKAAFYRKVSSPLGFDFLKINSKIDVKGGSFSIPRINATFYIENGKKIWLNFSAFFMDVARGMVTPDRAGLYENINRTYLDADLSYVRRLLNVDFLDFNSLQALITGRSFIRIDPNRFSFSRVEDGYRLTSDEFKMDAYGGNASKYRISMDYSLDLELRDVVVQDSSSSTILEISYRDYKAVNGERLPGNIEIDLKSSKIGRISVENTKFGFSEMSTPYVVPAGYTKIEVR